METIIINDGISKIVLHLNKKSFYGYRFYNNNKIEKIDKRVFKYFDFLYPSLNYTKLGMEDGYTVILDNDTKFKHYIKNGSLDFEKFILNNGKGIISYNIEDDIDSLKEQKVLRYYDKILKKIITVTITVSAALLIGIYNEYSDYKEDLNKYNSMIAEQDIIVNTIEFEDIKKEDLSKMIYQSKELDDQMKEYLDNQDLFEDILPYINKSNYMKYMYMKKFDQIKIELFEEAKYLKSPIGYVSGYYNPLDPNIIYLREKEMESDYSTYDTVSHEFIHLCQDSGKYENLIDEATAEIYSYEYYDHTEITTYKEQVNAVKKLMEIIGTEPIKEFVFNGDFTMIEEAVKPYLNDEEYKVFIQSLHYDFEEDHNSNKLNNIISILYKRMYNDDISNNELFSLIDNNKSLVRYYFNPRLINKEHSYYMSDFKTDHVYCSYEEAYNKGLIRILPNTSLLDSDGINYQIKEISYDEFIKGNYNDYKIQLYTDGYVDYDNQEIIFNVPSKIYIDPVEEKKDGLTK